MEKKKNRYDLKITALADTCTGCGACANICPVNAIQMQYDDEGFYYPVVDCALCVGCLACEQHCHVLAAQGSEGREVEFTPYMCWAKDDNLRQNSSSGGAFSLLANVVIDKGGVVFGARYNYEKERLEHNHTDNFDLSEFRKSKYIESNTLSTFNEVKQFLGNGRTVLYCGTPCQIIGLKSFLKDTDVSDLILVDFICHGVPSNKHFNEYKRYIEGKMKDKVISFDCRPKSKGKEWKKANAKIYMQSGRSFNELHYENLYFRAFQENLILRKSCYLCDIPNKHYSDVTIADFWGIACYKPESDDDRGISLVVVNSDKGQAAFGSIQIKEFQVERLPFSAIEYAYRQRTEEVYNFERRNIIAGEVVINGYIKSMKRLYTRDINVLKIKRIIRAVVNFVLQKTKFVRVLVFVFLVM